MKKFLKKLITLLLSLDCLLMPRIELKSYWFIFVIIAFPKVILSIDSSHSNWASPFLSIPIMVFSLLSFSFLSSFSLTNLLYSVYLLLYFSSSSTCFFRQINGFCWLLVFVFYEKITLITHLFFSFYELILNLFSKHHKFNELNLQQEWASNMISLC